jgi:DnaD/phage-associated family protein
LEGKRITKRFETFIINLAYAYGFNESEMQEIYNVSLNSSGHFDYMLCSKRSREKYASMHEAPLPRLAVKDDAKMSEEEELFLSLSAKALIEAATSASVATAMDIDKVQQLYQEYNVLPRSVVNVCVIYAIKKCEGTVPAYGYFDTILKDWVNKGINTFKAAQETIERTNKNANNKKKKPSNDPEWLKEYVEKFEEGVEDL